MKSRALVIAVLAWIFVQSVSAQDMLSLNTRIYSKDGRYFAYLSEKTSGTKEVQIFAVNNQQTLWSAWIDWRKTSYGLTSNDGAAFIVVDSEYSEAIAPIIVYSRQAPQAYSARSLPIEVEFLSLEATKYYWIDPVPFNFIINYTADGKALSMDLRMLNEKWIRIRLPQ